MNLPERPHLVFVETAADVERTLRDSARTRPDAFVALAPEAAGTLAQRYLPYLKLEDGYREEDLQALAEPVLEAQEDWADWVDGELATRISAFGREGFGPGRLYLYWLKLLFDSLSVRAFSMSRALAVWQPSSVRYAGEEGNDQQFGWDLMYRRSLYPAILRRLVAAAGIPADLPPVPPEKYGRDDATARHTNRLGRRARLHQLGRAGARLLKVLVERSLLLVDGTRPPGYGSLVAEKRYDTGPVRDLAKSRRLPLADWARTVDRFRSAANSAAALEMRREMDTAWHGMAGLERFRQPARAGSIDLWDMAESRLRHWYCTLIPQQWGVYLAVRQALAQELPSAVLVSGLGDHIERGVFAALRSIGVRSYMYQHGGFVGACESPAWDIADLWLAEYELTYGDGVTEYFGQRRARRSRALALPISVGSSRLDSLRRRMESKQATKKKRELVVLVPRVILWNNRYHNRGDIPDVTEEELQTALVAAAREFGGYEFVFKGFPAADQETRAHRLASEPGSNCRIKSRAPLPILMSRADLVVLTTPSTALLEALVTDAQVLVLVDGRSMEMLPEAKVALARRAYVEETPEAFLKRYRVLLEAGGFKRTVRLDTSFLERYGTHENDGQSAQRALEAVLAVEPAVSRVGSLSAETRPTA